MAPLETRETAKHDDPSQHPLPPDNPLLNAFMARVAIRGIKGELLPTNGSIEGMLSKSGPVGEQLLERLGTLEGKGWSLGPMTPIGDPYLSTVKNPLSRALRTVAIGGYNTDVINGEPIRRIAYNNLTQFLNAGFVTHGNASPLTRITSTVAHELGHSSGIPLDYTLSELTPAQQKIMALRLLETETNAVITQLHIADVNKAFHPDLEMFRPGLVDGTFGSRLKANWSSPGVPEMYKSLSLLTPQEADAHINKYVAENYGNIIDKKGRVGAFDLNKVYGKYEGQLPRDAEILAKLDEYVPGTKPPAVLGEMPQTLMEGKFGRGLQALGALGIAYQITDVGKAFGQSTGSGFGKIGRIGVQYGGAEVGSMVGAEIGTRLAFSFLGKGKLGMLVVPLSTIGGAMVGAITADDLAGSRVDKFIKNLIDGPQPA